MGWEGRYKYDPSNRSVTNFTRFLTFLCSFNKYVLGIPPSRENNKNVNMVCKRENKGNTDL